MSRRRPTHPHLLARRRDAQVRAVTRTTRTVAGLAVVGTAVFGGLAAAATKPPAPHPPGAAAQAATPARQDRELTASAATPRERPRAPRVVRHVVTTPPAPAPAPTPAVHRRPVRHATPIAPPPTPPAPVVVQAPVASSGGS